MYYMRKKSDIVERIDGYGDDDMVRYLDVVHRTLTKKKIVVEKRGRKQVEREVYANKVDVSIIERIERSISFYDNLKQKAMKSKIQLRPYQQSIVDRGSAILEEHGWVYLAMEVRTGKTLTSLSICDRVGAGHVLFLTKKKAIGSIEKDYESLCCDFDITVCNYESMHKVDGVRYDVVILDEAHSLGAFPKPSKRAIDASELIREHGCRVILLSGTPTPESYSQIYHQLYGIPGTPLSEFGNFYKFAHQFVNIKQKKINGLMINNYHDCDPEVMKLLEPMMIKFSQSDAGFLTKTYENVLRVRMSDTTYRIINKLGKDLVVEGSNDTILADTPVKLMSKIHQLCGGTIKFESGNAMVLDFSKAEFIRDHFKGQKIGIFYKFKQELVALQEVYGEELTTDLDEFNTSGKSIALQIVSGREGVSLRKAESLVYYNIDFSATSYWQSKDRMTTIDRPVNNVYWVFAEDGIEDRIYKAVNSKKDYTLSHFKKDFSF
jgi:hypothetical protein